MDTPLSAPFRINGVACPVLTSADADRACALDDWPSLVVGLLTTGGAFAGLVTDFLGDAFAEEFKAVRSRDVTVDARAKTSRDTINGRDLARFLRGESPTTTRWTSTVNESSVRQLINASFTSGELFDSGESETHDGVSGRGEG